MSDQKNNDLSKDVGAIEHSEHSASIDRLIESSSITDEEWGAALLRYGVDVDLASLDPVAREEIKRLLGGGTEGLTDDPSDHPDNGAPPP